MKAEFVTEMGMRYVEIPYYKESEEGVRAILPEFEYNLLEMTEISGLIGVSKRIINEKEFMLFPICGYASLEERFQKEPLNIDLFREFFGQLLQLYENMQTYLLDGNSVCLDYQYIFYDEQNKKYMFLPVTNEDILMTQKFENLFTFFSDICPLEEQELLVLIFENYYSLTEDNFEPHSFLKSIVDYKFDTEQLYNSNCEERIAEIMCDDKEIEEEKTFEKAKDVGVFVICMILLMTAFGFSYLVEYKFKYGIVSMTTSFIAIGLMAFRVIKITKGMPKRQNIEGLFC